MTRRMTGRNILTRIFQKEFSTQIKIHIFVDLVGYASPTEEDQATAQGNLRGLSS